MHDWKELVEVVHVDMRFWNPKEQCDILVSELLGSFGDNELSPECLDGCQRVIKKGGISIPANYTSFVAPLSSAKLFHEVIQYDDLEHVETPYVVKFHNVFSIAPAKPTWTFDHPHQRVMYAQGHPHFNAHNTRASRTTFDVDQDTVMHGIAGYFESVLYKDVTISIHPPTHSAGMFSWFPLYFPLKTPLFLPKRSQVDILIWRLTDPRKVWYEWSVVPRVHGVELIGEASGIHNPQGRSSWIGL